MNDEHAVGQVIVRFWQLPRLRQAVLLEATIQLLLAQIIIFAVPFRRLIGGLGDVQGESPVELPTDDRPRVYLVAWAIRAIVRRLPRPPKCLVQGVAAQWMLRRRLLASTLYLGVACEPSAGSQADSLQAHAWVRCGEIYVTGGAERHSFTIIAHFATQFPT